MTSGLQRRRRNPSHRHGKDPLATGSHAATGLEDKPLAELPQAQKAIEEEQGKYGKRPEQASERWRSQGTLVGAAQGRFGRASDGIDFSVFVTT